MLICSNCATANDAARKFCIECGTRLISGCPTCGAQNPDGAKFCGQCGTELSAPARASGGAEGRTPPAQPAPSAERRLVSVLFADLVGFTGQQDGQDPEDTRDFLTRYFEVARTIVERYGGTVEKFIGDAVMAVWGAPTAHEDDAERAVRAGLEIVDAVPALSDRRDVRVRAGVLTGEAAVTLGAAGQGMVAGDLVNTASRLQAVAPPGSVLVGEVTYRAASGAIAFEEAGEHLLKGKQLPVAAWRAATVVALRRGSGRSEALEPPFTGRDEELRLIKDLFHVTERERKPRLVSIVGQAGIGKSRLAWEFEKYIDGVVGKVYWHAGRSPAYGEGISYWALAEMVRGRAGIAETDDPAVGRLRLSDALAEWLPDETERRWVEPRLAALLALEPMPPGTRDELFAAWRLFFERVAERGPTVLVFEDVQWADDGMLDFIEELLDRSRSHPLFVMTLARPEIQDRRPGFGASLRSVTAMHLDPLEPADMGEMVRGTVPGIADDAVSALVERAEGVPLYAVETIRMLIDRGVLRAKGDGRYEMAARLDRLDVPETLHALIAARLDALEERDRRLLQAAAVIGQSFTADAAAAINGEPLDALRERLGGLVRRQLLRVEADPRSPERGQYQFVQAVVKEVAERSLARADRRSLHLAAARHYEAIGDDELAGVLASHYVEAYRATPAGPEAEALAAQARVALRAAADRATALHSHVQALGYAEQALAVTSDPLELAVLNERAARSAERSAKFSVATEHAVAAEQLYRELGDRLGALRGVTLQATAHLGEHGEQPAIALLRPALDAVSDLQPTSDIIRAQVELARALMLAGSHESVDWCNRVLTTPEAATDEELVETLITKGTVLITESTLREGEVILRGAIEVAERLALTSAALRARNNLLNLLALDNLGEAEAVVRDGYRISSRTGLTKWATQFAHVGLSTSFDRGDWEAWLDETADLGDSSTFYGGWRIDELARRMAFRGELETARAESARARQMIGTGSSQAAAAIGMSQAMLAAAAAEWPAVLPAARIGWQHYDSTIVCVQWAVTAALALDDRSALDEATAQLPANVWRGRYPDAVRAYAQMAAAFIDRRATEARRHYVAAGRGFDDAGARFWRAILDLAMGQHGADKVPEAAEAARAADEFFGSRGALAFVERYRGSAAAGASARGSAITPVRALPGVPAS